MSCRSRYLVRGCGVCERALPVCAPRGLIRHLLYMCTPLHVQSVSTREQTPPPRCFVNMGPTWFYCWFLLRRVLLAIINNKIALAQWSWCSFSTWYRYAIRVFLFVIYCLKIYFYVVEYTCAASRKKKYIKLYHETKPISFNEWGYNMCRRRAPHWQQSRLRATIPLW